MLHTRRKGAFVWDTCILVHTSWVAVITPNDCPMSVCNRCVIEDFCGDFCVVTLLFGFFCGSRGFCHNTESDLFFFCSLSGIYGFMTLIVDLIWSLLYIAVFMFWFMFSIKIFVTFWIATSFYSFSTVKYCTTVVIIHLGFWRRI